MQGLQLLLAAGGAASPARRQGGPVWKALRRQTRCTALRSAGKGKGRQVGKSDLLVAQLSSIDSDVDS